MADSPDLTEFFKLSRPKKPPCKVGFALSKLKGEQREQLRSAIDTDPGIITNAAIVEWMKPRGHVMHVAAVVSHRKGNCSCHDDA